MERLIKQAALQGVVTLITAAHSRGLDFRVFNQDINLNGGMHLLLTYWAMSIAEFLQLLGRIARMGKLGKWAMIL